MGHALEASFDAFAATFADRMPTTSTQHLEVTRVGVCRCGGAGTRPGRRIEVSSLVTSPARCSCHDQQDTRGAVNDVLADLGRESSTPGTRAWRASAINGV